MKPSKYERRDPNPQIPFEDDELDGIPALVAVIMLLISLTLWVMV